VILRFVCLSAAAHVVALGASYQPVRPWSIPAPELRITLSSDGNQFVRPRSTPDTAAPTPAAMRAPHSAALSELAAAPPFAAAADSSNGDTKNESEAQLTNHLRSALYAELKHYFVYPAIARRHGWQGRVEISLQLDSAGRLTDLQLVRSSGYAILDSNAIETLQRIGILPSASSGTIAHPQELALQIVYQLLDS